MRVIGSGDRVRKYSCNTHQERKSKAMHRERIVEEFHLAELSEKRSALMSRIDYC